MRTIREELDTLPPLGDIDAAVRSGRHARPGWVRTGGVLVATAAAVATLASTTSLLRGDQQPDRFASSGEPSASSAASPEEIHQAFLNAAATASLAARGNLAWRNSSVQALDDRNNLIEGSARAQANRWQGIFQANDREELRLILIDEAPMTADEAEQDCATRLELGHAATCEVTLDGDRVVQQITRGAQPDPEGWPLIPTQDFASHKEDLWLMQQTILRDPSGTTAYVAEVVKATTWDEAASRWVIDRTDLPVLAAEIVLPLAK